MREGGQQTDHPLERLIFFSDAVFAIAITLLVIEIHVPTREAAAVAGGYGPALLHLGPSFFGFGVSFLVIARFWMGHHAAFSQCGHFDSRLLWPNTLLLMAIAFMPFATAFMAQNLGTLVPTLFYNGVLLVTAILSTNVIRIVTQPGMLRADADQAVVARFPTMGWAVALGAATALALTPLAPQFSQIGLLTIPLWRLLLQSIWHVSPR